MKSRFGIAIALAISIATLSGLAESGPESIELEPTLNSEGEIKIPKDLPAALTELRKMLPPELLSRMQANPEDDMILYHHGLGTWLRNNWGLWKGSQLSEYFNQLGIFHPDDMSGIVLDSMWRELNGKPIRLEDQIAHYKEYWRQHSYPEKAKCPEHRSRLEWYASETDPEAAGATVHYFECRKKGETWIWQVDRGYYRPKEESLKDANAN
jgi:hypothetical protein